MIGGEAARRYAKALVEIADERGSLDETGEELNVLAAAVRDNADLRRVVLNPRFSRPDRVKVLVGLLESAGSGELVRQFARLVAEKDRVPELPAMALSYQQMADEKRGRVRAQVRSAWELSPEELEALRAKLEAMTGKDVLLEVEVDRELIGGVVCRMGGVVMDGSIRNQLKNLQDSLTAN